MRPGPRFSGTARMLVNIELTLSAVAQSSSVTMRFSMSETSGRISAAAPYMNEIIITDIMTLEQNSIAKQPSAHSPASSAPNGFSPKNRVSLSENAPLISQMEPMISAMLMTLMEAPPRTYCS